jgi:hypothetical protein
MSSQEMLCSKHPEPLSDGEGLQDLIFPPLGFNQVLKTFFLLLLLLLFCFFKYMSDASKCV